MESQVAPNTFPNTVWNCSLCDVFVALALRVLMNHYYSVHSNEVNFFVRCGVDDCPATFRRYHSFYKHVRRNHRLEYEAASSNHFCPQTYNKDKDVMDPINFIHDTDLDSNGCSTDGDTDTDGEDFHQVYIICRSAVNCFVITGA